MKFMVLLVALSHAALASLPVHPGGIGGLFKGPNSETIIKGPDGSVITAAAEGGEVHIQLDPIVVAEPTVAVVDGKPIEVVAVPAPPVEPEQSSDLIGPSGRIVTQGSKSVVAGPASTTVTGPAVLAETFIRGPPILTAAPGLSLETATVSIIAGPEVLVSPQLAISTAAPIEIPARASPLPYLESVSSTLVPPLQTLGISTPVQGFNLGVTGVEINGVSASPIPSIQGTDISTVSINSKILPLSPGLIPDQIAINNKQLGINPAFIPTANIIPPEIGITGRGNSRSEILTTPGLGVVGTGSNVQRGEADVSIRGPQTQVNPEVALSQQQFLGVQNQQALLNSQIAAIQKSADARLVTQQVNFRPQPELFTPTNIQQQNAVNLRQQQLANLAAIQQQEAINNRQLNDLVAIQQQEALNARQLNNLGVIQQQDTVNNAANQQQQTNLGAIQQQETPTNNRESPNLDANQQATYLGDSQQQAAVNNRELTNLAGIQQQQQQQASLTSVGQQEALNAQLLQSAINSNRQQQLINAANIQQRADSQIINDQQQLAGQQGVNLASIQQQNLLNAELAKNGVDASQVRLTNIDLGSVSGLPIQLPNSLRLEDSWARNAREVEKKQTGKI